MMILADTCNHLINELSCFLFRYLNLLHLSGLRMLNYITLGVVSCYQVSRWVKLDGGYIPFLQVFFTAFFTGSFSFLLFAVFIYSKTGPYFTGLYFNDTDGTLRLVPFIIIFFEGTAGSIITGMITSMFSEKYRDQK